MSVPLVDGEGVLCRPITAAAAPSTIDDTAEEENSFLCKEGELPALAVPEGSVPCLGGGNGFRDLPDGKVSDFEVEMLSNDFCVPKSVTIASFDPPRDPIFPPQVPADPPARYIAPQQQSAPDHN